MQIVVNECSEYQVICTCGWKRITDPETGERIACLDDARRTARQHHC